MRQVSGHAEEPSPACKDGVPAPSTPPVRDDARDKTRSRVNKKAKAFRTVVKSDRISWSDVYRRIAVDNGTGEVIEDIRPDSVSPKFDWHAPLPGAPRSINTTFYYRTPPPIDDYPEVEVEFEDDWDANETAMSATEIEEKVRRHETLFE